MHHPMTMVSSAASGLWRQPPVWRLPRRLRAAVMPSITCGYMSTAGRSRIQSGLASKPATLGRAAQPPRGAARHGSSMVRPRHLTCASSRRSRTSRDAREQEDAFGCAQLHAELSGHACALGVRLTSVVPSVWQEARVRHKTVVGQGVGWRPAPDRAAAHAWGRFSDNSSTCLPTARVARNAARLQRRCGIAAPGLKARAIERRPEDPPRRRHCGQRLGKGPVRPPGPATPSTPIRRHETLRDLPGSVEARGCHRLVVWVLAGYDSQVDLGARGRAGSFSGPVDGHGCPRR